MSAFAKRAGPSRLDLVPLHAPLRTCGWTLCFLLFYHASTMLWPVIGEKLVAYVYESVVCATLHNLLDAHGDASCHHGRARTIRIRSRSLRCARFDSQTRNVTRTRIARPFCPSSANGGPTTRVGRPTPAGCVSWATIDLSALCATNSRHSSLGGLMVMAGPTDVTLLYLGVAHGWILDLLAYSDTTVYHIVGYVCYGAFCFGVWLPAL